MESERLRVFVSSKMQELAAERAVIKEVLDEINVDAWVFEQDAGARPETIEESYREQLQASDLYIGVFWKGYGDYTIDEFELAKATGTDCLIYQKQDDGAEGRDPKLQAFLDRLGKVETGLTVQWFDTPEELREMVKRDTARWQTRIVRRYRKEGRRRGAGRTADPDLAVLRNKVRQFWVEGVLSRAVSDARLLDVSKESRSGAVDPAESTRPPYEDGALLEPGTGVFELFERLGRSMLILGEPGAGKTTLALELTRDLISRAERDESQPVPVVLNLSAWSAESRSLAPWIAAELSSKYQVPWQISRPWVERRRLVLVLDGLDEVADEHREACARAINRFGAELGFGGLVVTSRLEAYERLSRSVRLRANGAIYLRPLVGAQVDAYLDEAGEHLAGLRAALETDPELRELARSPLMLSVMSLAYRDRAAEDLRAEAAGSAAGRSASLFGTYVERAFSERPSARSYSRPATTSWLSWLARRMAQRSRTQFLIEDLQPSWLARSAHLRAYLLGFSAVFGLVFGGLCVLYRVTPSGFPGSQHAPPGLRESVAWLLACAVFFLGIGITDGFRHGPGASQARAVLAYLRRIATNLAVFGLLWVAILWLMIHLLEPDREYRVERFGVPALALTLGTAALGARRSLSRTIATSESLKLESSAATRGALWGLLGGGVFSIVGYLLGEGWVVLFWPLAGSALGAVLRGFQPRPVRGKTVPNQGMVLTMRTSLRAAVMALPLAAVVPLFCFAVDGWYLEDEKRLAVWSVSALVFLLVTLVAWFGGLDLGKHYLLRAVIGETRQGPWDFRRLLDDASRRNLMRRVGGGYMFAHRPLLDHFAALQVPAPAADEIHDLDLEHAASSAPAITAMAATAVLGAVILYVGLGMEAAAVAVGGLLLGIGALWLVVRSAVASALRADRQEDDRSSTSTNR